MTNLEYLKKKNSVMLANRFPPLNAGGWSGVEEKRRAFVNQRERDSRRMATFLEGKKRLLGRAVSQSGVTGGGLLFWEKKLYL